MLLIDQHAGLGLPSQIHDLKSTAVASLDVYISLNLLFSGFFYCFISTLSALCSVPAILLLSI